MIRDERKKKKRKKIKTIVLLSFLLILVIAGFVVTELFTVKQVEVKGNELYPDEQIEASIWQQIDSGNENDYIYFHLRKADGTYLSVLDHGSIVENQHYGRVFYVLFMDWADMHIRYSDKFSE